MIKGFIEELDKFLLDNGNCTQGEREDIMDFVCEDLKRENQNGEQNKAICVECKEEFIQDRDLQICDKCIKLFDLDKVWELHDKNELDALDFNESKKFRDRFRK